MIMDLSEEYKKSTQARRDENYNYRMDSWNRDFKPLGQDMVKSFKILFWVIIGCIILGAIFTLFD